MAGSNVISVICCFCGKTETHKNAVLLRISTLEMEDEVQELFAHKTCLSKALHASIPLHPELIVDHKI